MIVCVAGLALRGIVIACVCVYVCACISRDRSFCHNEYCCAARLNEYDSLCVYWCISSTRRCRPNVPRSQTEIHSPDPSLPASLVLALLIPAVFFIKQKLANFKDNTTADSLRPQAVISLFHTHLFLINKRLTVHM